MISRAVWLYHVFSLSLRNVELILAEPGIVVTLVFNRLTWATDPGVSAAYASGVVPHPCRVWLGSGGRELHSHHRRHASVIVRSSSVGAWHEGDVHRLDQNWHPAGGWSHRRQRSHLGEQVRRAG